MLSIIVPIHNGRPYNRLFLDSLEAYTVSEYELIVVDNCSSDGSAEMFEAAGARVIRNRENYCYACSMNRGAEGARGDVLCFANNDIWFGKAWDVPVLAAIGSGEWSVCPAGIEAAEDDRTKNILRKRWGWAGLPARMMGQSEGALGLSLKLMYGDWERFCEERSTRLKGMLLPGIQGNCVVCRKELMEKIGGWDVRTMTADWHFYLTVSRRSEEDGDVRKVCIAPDSYVHHFIRATARGKYPPFACGHTKRGLEGLWTEEEIDRYKWTVEK